MGGTDWLAQLPENPGNDRDKAVLDAVSSGLAYCKWIDVQSVIPGHTATFQVCDDAVRVDLDDGSRFRVQCSATLAQQCADAMSASLITAKVSDLAYKVATVVIPVTTLPAGPDMVTTTKSKQYNQALELKRAGRDGLLRDCGKAWIISNRLGSMPNGAVNYGFYDLKAPYVNHVGIRMWQTLGTRHDRAHTDYSQTLILMKDTCIVDGNETKVADLMVNPILFGLISDEGVLHFTRQPGV